MKSRKGEKPQVTVKECEEQPLDPKKTMKQVNRELDRKKVQIEILKKILKTNPNSNP